MSEIIDITPTVSERIGVWPGDVSFQRKVGLDMKEGANLTLSSIETTTHLGAHADGPNHYLRDGVGIGERPLHYYYGRCQVIEVRVPRGLRVSRSDLQGSIEAPRVLLKTGSFPDPDHFNEDFNGLSAGVISSLHAAGAILVGVDTPSIDVFHDKQLESHQAVARFDMAILEGLVLEHVETGFYHLCALPLKLEGADGSPVRAILIPENE